MKKNLILFCFVLFLTCGCSAEYNLIINDDNTVNESITVLQSNNLIGSTTDEINEQLDWSIIMGKDEIEPAYFYNMEKINGSKYSGVKYSYDFALNSFMTESDILKNCYEDYNVSVNDNKFNISASGFKCALSLGDSYDLKINITVKGKSLNGNYQQKHGNTYTWNINESKKNDIKLSVDRSTINDSFTNLILPILIIVAILLVSGIFILSIYNKNKINNRV